MDDLEEIEKSFLQFFSIKICTTLKWKVFFNN